MQVSPEAVINKLLARIQQLELEVAMRDAALDMFQGGGENDNTEAANSDETGMVRSLTEVHE